MREVSHSGVSVGEKKRVHMNRNITPLLSLKFLLKILEISTWFFGHVSVGNVIIVKGRIAVNFFN